MKLSLVKGLLLLITILFYQKASAQAFWTETFGSGCNTGTLADGETTTNGIWNVTNTGTNGTEANVWYISAEENGEGVGNCGAGCGTNPTLHIGASGADLGAAYLNGDGGIGLDPTTDTRAESPTIDCTGQCRIDVSFEYMENGDGALDNHILWYFDGSTWSVLDDTPKTPTGCSPQGEWTNFVMQLPPSADNNPDVKIGFQWVNNNDNTGTDPSVAIYNIQLTSNDINNPSLTCDSNVSAILDGNCDGSIPDLINSAYVTYSDNCTSIADLIVSQDVSPGTTISGASTVVQVEVTVEDLSGNESSCLVDVSTVDTMMPDLTCPPNQVAYTDASCESEVDDYLGLVSVVDNCSSLGDLTLAQSITPGTTISSDQNITVTATDESGNESSCIFTVELVDSTAPNITCPSNQSQETDNGTCDTLILDYTGQVIWSDNCTSGASNMVFQQSPSPSSLIAGANTVTITVTDSSGNSNSCDFDVTVIDVEDPTITCPPNETVPVNSACDVSLQDYSVDATVDDNCSTAGDITFQQSPSIGTVLSDNGTVQLITLTAEDEAGNTNSCDFEITLVDTTSPQVTCPPDITESADTDCEFSVPDYTTSTAATDNCYSMGDFTITQNIVSGTILNTGVHQIEMSVEDPAGNIGTCTFDLTVEDDIAPTINLCAPDQSEPTTSGCSAEISDYTSLISVDDNCDDLTDLIIVQSPTAGTVFTDTTVVTVTVTDLSGNSSDCDFEVTINDVEDPVIDCPSDTVVTVNSTCDYSAPDLTGEVSGSDNCSSFGDMTITQDPVVGASLNGAEVIEITLTDENGNSTTCNVNVTPDDTIPPSVTCPADQFVSNGTDCDYEIDDFTTLANASDNCTNVTLTQIPSPGTEIGTGLHMVEIIATDGVGNTDTCTFELEVTESISPTIDCSSDTSSCDSIVNYDAPTVSDNCTGFSIAQIDGTGLTSGDAFPIGVTTQTYEVQDPSGNTSSCSFNIEVFEAPSQAEILTNDTQLCDTTSFVIEAEDPEYGTGEWYIVSGSANFNNEFANQTGVNNLSYGENEFVWEVSTANCGSTSDTLLITVYQQPLPANTQDTLTMCSDTSINIAANSPSVGIGTWSDVDSNVLFLNNNFSNTLAYNLNGGWNNLVWTITNGNCPATSDTLSIFAKLNAEVITNDTNVCVGEQDLMLVGSKTPSGVTNIWYVINGTAEFETPTSSSTIVSGLSAGENTIVFAQNHPICGTTHDTLIVTSVLCDAFDPEIPTVITPNNDGRNDLFIIENLNLLYPDCEMKIVNRWGGLVFESTGYEEPWDGTKMNEGEPLPMGTYFYRIFLKDDEGTEITGSISIIR
ncbi:MAG: HYR domain-containing protein [Brumimicrobium sp.]